jgi:hypothetical protein
MTRPNRLLLIGVCAVLAAPAAIAQADVTADGCAAPKLVASDATGDQSLFGLPVPGSNDLDLTAVRLGAIADGTGRVTFDIPTLDKTVPLYATGLSWYFDYTVNGEARFASATLDTYGNVNYATGTRGQSYLRTGTTYGSYTAGSPGRITIDLPDVAWGDTLSAMAAHGYYDVEADAGVTDVVLGPRPGDDVAIAGTQQLPGCAG